MAKVLVAGGAGYIGGAVTQYLLAKGIPFTVYDNLLYEPHYLKEVDFIFGDVRDTVKLKRILPRYTHVVWLAAIVGDGACEVNSDLTTSVNQDAVEWLAENFAGRIIFTSTCSVYGHNPEEVDEHSSLNPLSHYARTKVKAEQFLNCENSLIFRLGTAFGISDTYARPRMDLVANQMAVAALTRGELRVNGGSQWRPLIHVNDIALAIVHNLERPVRGIYNLASFNIQIADLAESIRCATNCKVTYASIGQDQRDYRVNLSKALRDEIFSPSRVHSIGDSVRQFASLIRSGRVKHTENEAYFNVRYIGKLKTAGELAEKFPDLQLVPANGHGHGLDSNGNGHGFTVDVALPEAA
jgi:nucleoside-diphosphate-sugar epimerase